ncbi:type II toxin-antitoxin system VapB family antitoxin [Aeromonas veronii]|uniref:type II toxin-antitoxin system VapB family antitoxin n=1 Tax=Aeromonas veronii TaxID=654 RepID=UPI002F96DB3F
MWSWPGGIPARGRGLPDEVTHVEIVVVGRTRIITPVGESWDRWFDEPCMSADFMAEREQPTAQEREKL